jgi:hypothetical protein
VIRFWFCQLIGQIPDRDTVGQFIITSRGFLFTNGMYQKLAST